MSHRPSSRIDAFLKDKSKRPQLKESNDQQEVKAFIDRKLFSGEKSVSQSLVRVQNVPRFYQFHRKSLMAFRKETMPLCFFVAFTTYVLYKMEATQNNIQRTISTNKSFKQQQIEDEENEIAAQLMGRKVDTLVPIGDTQRKQNIYKFENFEEEGMDEEGMVGFSTKSQMVEDILKEKEEGLEVPAQFRKEVERQERKELYKNMKEELLQKKKGKKDSRDSVLDH